MASALRRGRSLRAGALGKPPVRALPLSAGHHRAIRTPTILQGEPHNLPSPTAGQPEHVCTACKMSMEHLADFREAGAQPAKRIFLCRGCKQVTSELL